MKRKICILAFIFLFALQLILLSGCPDSTSDATGTVKQTESSQAITFTTLATPFNGDGDWYLTQPFGSYYTEMNGHHTGEDWNLAGDDSGNCAVYSIAPGEVVDSGLISASLGYYMIIQHTGNFKIPASNNGHLNSLIDLKLESKIYAQYLFSEGTLLASELGNNFLTQGTDDKDAYSYPETTVSTIYSVYLHINDPGDFIKTLGESKYITQEMLDNPIATLANGLSFPSHLHFEIRVGEKDDILGSTISGTTNGNGYSDSSQKMVDAGYREPSSIIQANGGQCSITGDVLGEIEGFATEQTEASNIQIDTSRFLPFEDLAQPGLTTNSNEYSCAISTSGDYDLDGTGEVEHISIIYGMDENPSIIQIDDYDMGIDVSGEEICNVFLIDLDKNDKFTEIAVLYDSGSDDYFYNLYRYDGQKIIDLGIFGGYPYSDGEGKVLPEVCEFTFTPQIILSWDTLIGNSWEEHVIDKSAWIGKEYEFAKDNQYSLFTVCDSLPDDSMSLEYNWAEFKKGTKFTLLDIDSDNYMFLISLEDGRKGVLSFYLSD